MKIPRRWIATIAAVAVVLGGVLAFLILRDDAIADNCKERVERTEDLILHRLDRFEDLLWSFHGQAGPTR